MTATYGSVGPSSSGTGTVTVSSPLAWTHTALPADNVILIGVNQDTSIAQTMTCTVNGSAVGVTSLGLIDTSGNTTQGTLSGGYVQVWLATVINAGAANAISVSVGSTTGINCWEGGSIGAAGYTGYGTPVLTGSGSSPSNQISIAVSGVASTSLVVAFMAQGNGGTVTQIAGTQRFTNAQSTAGSTGTLTGATATGTGSVTITTNTGSSATTTDSNCNIAVELQGVAGIVVKDPSTPAAVDVTGTTSATVVTGSFSPPAGSWVTVTVGIELDSGGSSPAVTVADSLSNAYTAGPAVYDAQAGWTGQFRYYYASAPGSITVTATRTVNLGAALLQIVTYVLADAAVSGQPAGVSHAGTSSATNTSSITTTVTGSFVTVSNTVDSTEASFTPSGISTQHALSSSGDTGSCMSGYVNTGTPGATTLGWTVPTAQLWAWAAWELLPASTMMPVVNQTSLPPAAQGQAYSQTLTATGGTGSGYTWAVTTGSLPGWASLNSSTGAITGTVTGGPASTTFTVTVTDSGSNTATQVLTLSVAANLSLVSAIPAVAQPGLFSPGTLVTTATTPSDSDSGTGTDSQSVLARISNQDSGAGTDQSAFVGVASLLDSGTGTDATGSVLARVSNSDSAAGTDSNGPPVLFQAESGTGTDGQSVLAQLSNQDSGAGTDGQLAPDVVSSPDSGAGTDATGSVLAQISNQDSGAGTDAGSVLAQISNQDSGAGTDATGSVLAEISSQDSAAGADAGAAFSPTPSSFDSGLGVDAGSVLAQVSSFDSGAGTDLQSVQALVSDSDNATGIDAQRLTLFQADTATGTDAQTLLYTPLGTDSGAGTDGNKSPAVVALADNGTGIDANGPPVLFQPDSGAGTDAQVLLYAPLGSDSGTGTDAQGLTAYIYSSDSATGVDAGSTPSGNTYVYDTDFAIGREADIEYPPDGQYIQVPQLDGATGVDSQSMLAQPADFDSGTGTETQSVFAAVQVVSDSDFGTGYELWSAAAPKADSDSGAAADAQVLLYAPSDIDSGTGVDAIGPPTVYSWLPYGLFSMPGGTGGIRVVWRPGTDEERELLRVPDVVPSSWLTEFAEMIRLADSLNHVSDSDSATGVELSKPTATVVQFAVAARVQGGAVDG